MAIIYSTQGKQIGNKGGKLSFNTLEYNMMLMTPKEEESLKEDKKEWQDLLTENKGRTKLNLED